jgi:hypothetical protein
MAIPKEITAQYTELVLHFDLMYINGIPMLTTIDGSIRYRTAISLNNRTAKELYAALDKVFRLYNGSGFLFKFLSCDGEFKPLMDPVKDQLGTTMNYTSTGEHESVAERNNRTIQERIRAVYHSLPFKAIPKVMLQHLAMDCTQKINYFPAKGGVSDYYSPYVIMSGKKLDYNKHLRFQFGSYVQANQDNNPTNTNAPRTIDAIYLRPMDNIQGGHYLMDL